MNGTISDRAAEPRIPGQAARPISPTQRERADKLQRIFTGIEKRVASGVSVRKAIRIASARWKGRHYRTGKAVRFSANRLAALFYAWRRNGDRALKTRYFSKPSKLSPQLVQEFLMECLKPDVLSMLAAYRRLALPPVTPHGFYRALPTPQKRALIDYHRLTKKAERLRSTLMRSV